MATSPMTTCSQLLFVTEWGRDGNRMQSVWDKMTVLNLLSSAYNEIHIIYFIQSPTKTSDTHHETENPSINSDLVAAGWHFNCKRTSATLLLYGNTTTTQPVGADWLTHCVCLRQRQRDPMWGFIMFLHTHVNRPNLLWEHYCFLPYSFPLIPPPVLGGLYYHQSIWLLIIQHMRKSWPGVSAAVGLGLI